VPENPVPLPDFTRWPSFPFEGDLRVKDLAEPVDVEPPRSGEDANDCVACNTPDEAYIWVGERWRVRAMDRPTGLPMVLILECRSHLDLGDLPNLLAAELGVMTVRLERAVRSLDGVARVHVNRWGDGSAHLHMWFLARPYGRLQLRGTFLSLWDDILPVIPEPQWRQNLAHVAAWLGEFGGRPIAEPPHIAWQSPSTVSESNRSQANLEGTEERTPAGGPVPADTGYLPADPGTIEESDPVAGHDRSAEFTQTPNREPTVDYQLIADRGQTSAPESAAAPEPVRLADDRDPAWRHPRSEGHLPDEGYPSPEAPFAGSGQSPAGIGNEPTRDLSAFARIALTPPPVPAGPPPAGPFPAGPPPAGPPPAGPPPASPPPASPPPASLPQPGPTPASSTPTSATPAEPASAEPAPESPPPESPPPVIRPSTAEQANSPTDPPAGHPPTSAATADATAPADTVDRLVGERTTVAYPLRPTTPPRSDDH
jgi:hypothetical protein